MDIEQLISQKLQELDSCETRFFSLSKDMLSSKEGLYHLDWLAVAVINRSLSLISGFTSLIREKNFIAAVHLVRPHLDNYLRFSAAWLVDNPHQFVNDVMQGHRIDKLKDRDGKFLRDSYLVEIGSKEYPWIQEMYKQTSGFVHLSKKHIFTSTILKDLEGTVEFKIGKEDRYVPEVSRVEAIGGMIEITNCIFHLLEGWIWTKNNPEENEILKNKHSG